MIFVNFSLLLYLYFQDFFNPLMTPKLTESARKSYDINNANNNLADNFVSYHGFTK